jgi:hypothetical protein
MDNMQCIYSWVTAAVTASPDTGLLSQSVTAGNPTLSAAAATCCTRELGT